MRSLFAKLSIVLAALVGWLVYDNWERLPDMFFEDAKQMIRKDIIPQGGTAPITTTIYKWRDAEGNWQFSNEKPLGITGVETLVVHSDQNVIPAVTVEPKEKAREEDSGESRATGLLDHYRDAIDSARNVEQVLEERKQKMDRMTD